MMNERPVPSLPPGLVDPASMAGEQATIKANAILDRFNAALANRDAESLANCFYASQAYWKDILALTCHLRTFSGPGVIAAALLQTNKSRQIENGVAIDGAAMFLPATPVLVSKKSTRIVCLHRVSNLMGLIYTDSNLSIVQLPFEHNRPPEHVAERSCCCQWKSIRNLVSQRSIGRSGF